MVYVLPIILPNVRFLTLAAMIFLFAEVLMHLIMFPIRLKTFYNAGLVTTIGLGIIACCYFFGDTFNVNMFRWYDYVLAVVWFGVNFLFFFRSKLYWNLGKKPDYDLTQQSAFSIGFKK